MTRPASENNTRPKHEDSLHMVAPNMTRARSNDKRSVQGQQKAQTRILIITKWPKASFYDTTVLTSRK